MKTHLKGMKKETENQYMYTTQKGILAFTWLYLENQITHKGISRTNIGVPI